MTISVRRCALIANPSGGRRRGAEVLQQVVDTLRKRGVESEVHQTLKSGHAVEIARRLDLSQLDAIGIIGGDGTVHEVVNGLLSMHRSVPVPLALIPAGTGNTVHHQLGCHDVHSAIDILLRGETRGLDVARVEFPGQIVWCINIVGFGVVAEINRTAERLRRLGAIRYSLAAIWQIIRPRARRVQLTTDGQCVTDDVLFVMACNTKSTGAGMLLAPMAEIDDGCFEIVVLKKTSRLELLRMFRRVFDGSHLSLPSVSVIRAREFALHWTGTEDLNLDGELVNGEPFSATVLSDSLLVLTPSQQAT
ncbi:MAG: diacylglycerol kinase family lipid kinase [Planctomycetaceae bacterium]|nr:diacylglycerol kinase family lipid kinase [Planctomycetaceae bacterium]